MNQAIPSPFPLDWWGDAFGRPGHLRDAHSLAHEMPGCVVALCDSLRSTLAFQHPSSGRGGIRLMCQ